MALRKPSIWTRRLIARCLFVPCLIVCGNYFLGTQLFGGRDQQALAVLMLVGVVIIPFLMISPEELQGHKRQQVSNVEDDKNPIDR